MIGVWFNDFIVIVEERIGLILLFFLQELVHRIPSAQPQLDVNTLT